MQRTTDIEISGLARVTGIVLIIVGIAVINLFSRSAAR